MKTVGIRDLKAHLSSYLARVERGERIVVSKRGKPIASISPTIESMVARRIDTLLRNGSARWSGGKPKGLARPIRLKSGPTLAETVLPDRR